MKSETSCHPALTVQFVVAEGSLREHVGRFVNFIHRCDGHPIYLVVKIGVGEFGLFDVEQRFGGTPTVWPEAAALGVTLRVLPVGTRVSLEDDGKDDEHTSDGV